MFMGITLGITTLFRGGKGQKNGYMRKIAVISSKWIKCALFALLLALIAGAAAGGAALAAGAVPPDAVVVLDAGHGGFDGGVVAADGSTEAEINLRITMRVKKRLEEENIAVVLTRTDASALGANKREDMLERARIIKSSGADAVISIHVNKYTSPSRRGVQVFYGDTGTGGAFAAKLQSVFNTYLNEKYCGRSYSALAGDYFIAKCSSIPSVIAECGFISNSEDLKLLKSSAYADEIAECIARCVKSAAAGV